MATPPYLARRASDWTPEPGVNNGGLRWLKEKVAELSDD